MVSIWMGDHLPGGVNPWTGARNTCPPKFELGNTNFALSSSFPKN